MFALDVPGVLAIEGGPITPSYRQRTYPVSIFELLENVANGVGVDPQGNPHLMPGARMLYGDLHNILEKALIGGKSGRRDGEEFEVGPQMANRLVNEYLPKNIERGTVLAWEILRAAISSIDLKKKPQDIGRGSHSPSSEVK